MVCIRASKRKRKCLQESKKITSPAMKTKSPKSVEDDKKSLTTSKKNRSNDSDEMSLNRTPIAKRTRKSLTTYRNATIDDILAITGVKCNRKSSKSLKKASNSPTEIVSNHQQKLVQDVRRSESFLRVSLHRLSKSQHKELISNSAGQMPVGKNCKFFSLPPKKLSPNTVKKSSAKGKRSSGAYQKQMRDDNACKSFITPLKKTSVNHGELAAVKGVRRSPRIAKIQALAKNNPMSSDKPVNDVKTNVHAKPGKKFASGQKQITTRKSLPTSVQHIPADHSRDYESSTPITENMLLSGSVKMHTSTPLKPLYKAAKPSTKSRGQKNVSDASQKQKSKTVKKLSASHKQVNEYLDFLATVPVDDLISRRAYGKRKAKSADFKLPRKNTLKRKRQTIQAVRNADEGYEDDIYECGKFDKFQKLLMNSPVSNMPCSIMPTPIMAYQVTPLVRKKTPVFKDCLSPREYALSRKVAEECFYRNKKRGKSASQVATPVAPEKKKLEFSAILSEVRAVQEEIEKLGDDDIDDGEENDSYFSFNGEQ